MVYVIGSIILIIFLSLLFFWRYKNSKNYKLKRVNGLIDELDRKLIWYMSRLDKEELSYKDRQDLKSKLEQGFLHRSELFNIRWKIKMNKDL